MKTKSAHRATVEFYKTILRATSHPLNVKRANFYKSEHIELPVEPERASEVPCITVDDPDYNQIIQPEPDLTLASETEAEMSSSHRSSSGKGKSSSSGKSQPKQDDWSGITDPEERRRVQNRLAQRKYRDKTKADKERQDRDNENRAHAGHSYHTADPNDVYYDTADAGGSPWGSVSMKHVVSKGRAREDASRHGTQPEDEASYYENPDPAYEGEPYYGGETAASYEGDQAYYDYGSAAGSGSGTSGY